MSKKILIFGNGISLRYTDGEYDYTSLVKKFIDGIETSIELHLGDSHIYFKNQTFKDLFNSFNKNNINFNEGYFFDIYKLIFFEVFKRFIASSIRLSSFKGPEDAWKRCYDSIEDESIEPFISYLKTFFSLTYNVIEYAIKRSVSIDISNNKWIEIKYSNIFLENIQNYHSVYTTNYYVGNLDEKYQNINYLHGEIDRVSNDNLFSSNFTRNQNEGGEFKLGSSTERKILFGKTYQDKVFLNSIINWGNELKRVVPVQKLDFTDCEIDIVGLSTEGDKDLIQDIINQAKTVNIYYHDIDKDKKDWESVIGGKSNCQLFSDIEYHGFIGEEVLK